MSELGAKISYIYSHFRPRDLTAPRVLARKPRSNLEGHSARRLNRLALGMKTCGTYLEIGVAQGLTLEQVRVKEKVGVDPTPQFDALKLPKNISFFQSDSDTYFTQHVKGKNFDLIFLDGLHVWTQTYKDLLNALDHSNLNSIILLDDVIPDNELSAFPDWDAALKLKDHAGHKDGRWQGDVYKVLIAVSRFHPELEYCVVGKRDGIDNPQALIWKKSEAGLPASKRASAAQLEEIASMNYSDAFPDQEPLGIFALIPEAEGITRALYGVS